MNRVTLRGSGMLLALVTTLAFTGCAHLVVLHDPLVASEHNDLGVAYEAAGQPKLAADQYRCALRSGSHDSRTWVNLGNVQAAQGRWRPAEKSYRHALRDSASNADAMNNLGIALLRQGRDPAQARAWVERAILAGGDRDTLYRATLEEVTRGGR